MAKEPVELAQKYGDVVNFFHEYIHFFNATLEFPLSFNKWVETKEDRGLIRLLNGLYERMSEIAKSSVPPTSPDQIIDEYRTAIISSATNRHSFLQGKWTPGLRFGNPEPFLEFLAKYPSLSQYIRETMEIWEEKAQLWYADHTLYYPNQTPLFSDVEIRVELAPALSATEEIPPSPEGTTYFDERDHPSGEDFLMMGEETVTWSSVIEMQETPAKTQAPETVAHNAVKRFVESSLEGTISKLERKRVSQREIGQLKTFVEKIQKMDTEDPEFFRYLKNALKNQYYESSQTVKGYIKSIFNNATQLIRDTQPEQVPLETTTSFPPPSGKNSYVFKILFESIDKHERALAKESGKNHPDTLLLHNAIKKISEVDFNKDDFAAKINVILLNLKEDARGISNTRAKNTIVKAVKECNMYMKSIFPVSPLHKEREFAIPATKIGLGQNRSESRKELSNFLQQKIELAIYLIKKNDGHHEKFIDLANKLLLSVQALDSENPNWGSKFQQVLDQFKISLRSQRLGFFESSYGKDQLRSVIKQCEKSLNLVEAREKEYKKS